jgi:hypothetical protein
MGPYVIYGQFALNQNHVTCYAFSQPMLELFITVWNRTVKGPQVDQPDNVSQTRLDEDLEGLLAGMASLKKLAMVLPRFKLAKKGSEEDAPTLRLSPLSGGSKSRG